MTCSASKRGLLAGEVRQQNTVKLTGRAKVTGYNGIKMLMVAMIQVRGETGFLRSAKTRNFWS